MTTCNSCYQPIDYCTCVSVPYQSGCCTPVVNNIDASTVLYHKDNTDLSALINLNLPNGTPVDNILEAIDSKISALTGILSLNLTYLRTKYTINTLSQFLVAVNDELSALNTTVLAGATWTTAARPTSPVEGQRGYNLTTHHPEYWNGSAWIQI